MSDRATKITQLRKDFTQANIDKAGLESKKEQLQKQKNEALAELNGKGIKFEEIDQRIAEAEDKVDLVIGKMDGLKTGNAQEAAI